MSFDIMNSVIPAQVARHKHPPSDMQVAIYDACRQTGDDILIEAVAGSGKTTTIIDATQYVGEPVMFLAFAKANADDVRGKIIVGEARTINSLGAKICWQNMRNATFDQYKMDGICDDLLTPDLNRRFGYVIRKIIETAKNSGVGCGQPVDQGDFEHFITNGDWDIDDSDVGQVSELTFMIYKRSVSDLSTYDFSDQVYLPIYMGWSFPNFGTVLVDECQDLNALQHMFLDCLKAAGCRLICVGDRNQAIYAFRGALGSSMDLLKHKFSMLELPLSVCYRCPTSVIAEAQKLVPHIQARPDAPPGSVVNWAEWKAAGKPDVDLNEITDPEIFPQIGGKDQMIICRNNAPLFGAVMRHVRARIPCRVRSNALEGLESFIKRFRTDDPKILSMKVAAWLDKEATAARAKGMDWKVAALEDKAATVESLMIGFTTVSQIISLLRTLKEGKTGPIFSTIHKAKGLESEHVWFMRPDLVPGWWVKDEEAIKQEYNLRYVAITRAQQSLTYGCSQERRRR